MYWDENNSGQPTNVYLAQFLKPKENYNFIGVLDKNNFKRTSFGIEKNQKGEVYVGYHENNLRHGRGVYHFPDKVDGEYNLTSIYMGYWKENKKHGSGSYIWKKDKIGVESSYQSCLITAFIGWFFEDRYDVGLFYEDGEDGSLTLYYGKFDENNKKSDPEGFFYHNSQDETYVVICNIQADKVEDGIKFSFKRDDASEKNNFLNFVEFKYGKDTHENLKEGEKVDDMNEKTKGKYDKAQKFIDLLFKEEDFKKIYEAAIVGEKAYKEVKTLDDFHGKFATVLKDYCAEGKIKIDDKIRQEFPRKGDFVLNN